VTKRSSPSYIFDAILSRSKGLNMLTVTTLFFIVVKEGIIEVREYAKNLPSMSGDDLFTHIIDHFLPEKVNTHTLSIFVNMAEHLESRSSEWNEELHKFSIKDTMCFFLVLTLNNQITSVTSLDFHKLLNYEEILSDLPNNIKLSNTGTPITFATEEKLRNFILYMSVFEPDENREFNVSLKTGD